MKRYHPKLTDIKVRMVKRTRKKMKNIFWSQQISKFLTSLNGLAFAPSAVRSGFGKGKATTVPADFKPILRFVACSDIHLKPEGNPDATIRFGQLFDDMYAYSEKSDCHNTLDAVLVAGDFTGRGTEAQMLSFKQTLDENLKEGTEATLSLASHEYFHDGEESALK